MKNIKRASQLKFSMKINLEFLEAYIQHGDLQTLQSFTTDGTGSVN